MWDTLKRYGTELYEEWEKDNVSSLAAALAYYATFSLVPTVIILIAIGSAWANEAAVQANVLREIKFWLGPAAAELAHEALEGSTPASARVASLLSIAAVLSGATQLFAELQSAMNRVWEVKPKGKPLVDTIKRRALAVVLVLCLGALLIGSIIASTAISIANDVIGGFSYWEVVVTLATFTMGTLLFSLMFKHFPAVQLQLRDVRLGAALTTSMLMLSKYLFALYIGNTAISSTYGAAGTLIVFLIWVYLSAQIVLIGAEFTQVHCRIQGRDIQISDRAEARFS